MNKRSLLIVILFVVFALGVVFYLLRYPKAKDSSEQTSSKQNEATTPTAPPQSDVAESRVPPIALPVEAAKRLAAEQKWASSHNGPVAFYAKVIDQYGTPVQNANLTIALSVFDEGLFVNDKDRVHTIKSKISSDAQGLFELKRDKASSLWVESLERNGYAWTYPAGLESFDFSPMNRPKQPPDYKDPNRRFVFHLWKKGATEPVIHQNVRIRLTVEEEAYGVNLVTGKRVDLNESPDLIIRIPLVTDPNSAARGDRLFIFEIPSGGILETSEVYPYLAPLDGYQTKWVWLHEVWASPGLMDTLEGRCAWMF